MIGEIQHFQGKDTDLNDLQAKITSSLQAFLVVNVAEMRPFGRGVLSPT
jgi:hypothetical protein